MTLAVLDPAACPDCGNPILVDTIDQPALLRHGGYGATHTTHVRWCPCGYTLRHQTQETRP